MKKPKLHRQEKPYSCTVACLKMVFEHYGIHEEEKTLRIKSKTKSYGTHPLNAIECAKSYGLNAYVGSLNLDKLRELVNQNIPVIANILKFSDNEFYIHSAVVHQIKKDIIYLLDPEDGEMKLDLDLFERAWENNDCTAMVVQRVA